METPPSETWQIKMHPNADSLTMAAAGGSSHSIAIWNCENAQKEQDLQVSGVGDLGLKSFLCLPSQLSSFYTMQ